VILGSSLLISASLFAALDGFGKTMLGNAPLISWVLIALGGAIVFNAWPRDPK
jgi:hypothetical protein